MTLANSMKPSAPRLGNTHPVTDPEKLPPAPPGTRRVIVAMHASHSGVTASMPVTLPAWPDGWPDDVGEP